jgi:ribonuclease PH
MARKPQKRRANELRPIRIARNYIETASGSALIEMGRTRVLCTASFVPELPRWRQESGLGWVTAEYSMLPASTYPRRSRSRFGHTDGRGTEIQRLIGRVLRAVVDFEKLGPNTIYLDCDVLRADGGTRTAAINGSFVALVDALRFGLKEDWIQENPLTAAVAAVSVGLVKGKPVLDLDYELDSQADVDMNIAMTDKAEFIEVQGCAEQGAFSQEQLDKMLRQARRGIKQIIARQKKCLKLS